MSTAAEQEAERRYPKPPESPSRLGIHTVERFAFVAGWNECESRHRELLEAAREYREAEARFRAATAHTLTNQQIRKNQREIMGAKARLVDAAAALNEEGGE